MYKIQGVSLVSRTGDDPLHVVCCAFVHCALRVLLVCNVLVLVLVCHAEPPSPPPPTHTPLSPCVRSKRSPCAHSKRPRVYQHHARKGYHMRAWCRYTRGRCEFSHAGFQRATPQHAHTPRPQRHTKTTQQQPHNTRRLRQRETERDRERQRETEKEDTERETEEERQDKTRRERDTDKKTEREKRRRKRRDKRQEKRR